MIVADWIAGQLTGSRRSRRCCMPHGQQELLRSQIESMRSNTNIHINLPREQTPTRGVQQQNALNQIQRLYNQQIILPIIHLPQQPIQAIDQPKRNIPLKALLQLEELLERRVVGQFLERFPRRRFLAWVDYRATLLGAGLGRGRTTGRSGRGAPRPGGGPCGSWTGRRRKDYRRRGRGVLPWLGVCCCCCCCW